MKLLVNGQPIDSERPVISALDHGFLYGMGLFETFRTYNGRAWLLDRHADRLKQSCETLGIDYAPDVGAMQATVTRALELNGLADGYVRWSVSAGAGAIGLPSEGYGEPIEIVYAKELASDTPGNRKGKALRLLRTQRSTPETPVRLKSFHYMNNIVAKRELVAAGAAQTTEGLFLNGDGHVVEGTVSNVFWAKDGKLFTPSVDTGPLPGITRAYVMELAERGGILVREGRYGWDELPAADEVFVTNSIQEVVPVIALEDSDGRRSYPGGSDRAGSITAALMTEYRKAAERTSE